MVNFMMFIPKVINNTFMALLLVISNSSSVWSQPPRLAKGVCHDPVGRVINGGDVHLSAGSLICPEDRIQPAKGSMVEVICLTSRRILEIKQSDSAAQVCAERVSQPRRLCILDANCRNTRGSEERENPTLIAPYVGRIINPRPKLSWLEVLGATSYIVQVEGSGGNWSKEIPKTSLEYPLSEPAMEWGRIYKINVIANKGDEPVSASSSVTIVLPQEEAQEINRVVEKIQNLNLSADELAIDLDAVYMSKNLLTEAIGVLEARVRNGTQNPAIYRMLGDRYLETGLLETHSLAAAIRAYAEAVKLARQKNDAEELAKAQAGVKLLESQSQAPTRTNAAQ
ncbi:hypothetical protein BMF81_04708 (plasmid) [Nodularia spumigena UHCC 0039]|jgi:hypothetical protein|uniref:Tetratricopeptide repeat protein n=4 Tax=Nodularia spumigena TaxID=70799 RepID=A0A2S0QBI6_NODSP|nr:hypothetical protein BMF81_04708 [Nodularia spumigena UHCC 0039]